MSPKQLGVRLQRLGVAPGAKLLIAVSGGADSLALLDLCCRLRASYPLSVAAVHVNHQLRAASAAEAVVVTRLCEQLAVPLTVKTWPQAAHPKHGLEAAARHFRYQAFATVARENQATAVLTAHHQDDQAETVLFRLFRSGAAMSAAGIAPRSYQDGLLYLRPLLDVPRAALREYATMRQLPVQEDASNQDVQFSRNFLRHRVLPGIRARFPQVTAHLARFAREQQGVLALAEVTIRTQLDRLGPDDRSFQTAVLADLPDEARALVIHAAVKRVVADATVRQLDAVVQACYQPDGEQRTIILGNNWQADIRAGQVQLRQGPRETSTPRVTPVNLQLGESLDWADGTYALMKAVPPGWQLLTGIPATQVTLRTREAGDWVLLPHDVRQKLRRLLINAHFPATQRATLRLACVQSQVLWIADSPLNHLLKPVATDKIKANLIFKPRTER